ncbi:MAG: copper resistance CopC family protein, partial [Alphaproteobacteria bacterium]
MRSGFLIACVLVAAFAAPHRAGAHAVLLGSDPEHRAVLPSAPARIVLRFNEPVTPVDLRVLDARGQALVLPRPAHAVDRDVQVELPAKLGAGTYVVSFRVTSADGHPVGGALLFAVGAPPERWGEEIRSPESGARRWAAIANRGVHLLCVFFAAGGLLFAA